MNPLCDADVIFCLLFLNKKYFTAFLEFQCTKVPYHSSFDTGRVVLEFCLSKTVTPDLTYQKNQIVRLITNKAECKIDTSMTYEV